MPAIHAKKETSSLTRTRCLVHFFLVVLFYVQKLVTNGLKIKLKEVMPAPFREPNTYPS